MEKNGIAVQYSFKKKIVCNHELLICIHEEDEGFVYVLSLESIIKMDKYYILVMVLNLFLTSWAQKDLQGHSRSSEWWGARQSLRPSPRNDHICSICQRRVWLRHGIWAGDRPLLLRIPCESYKMLPRREKHSAFKCKCFHIESIHSVV